MVLSKRNLFFGLLLTAVCAGIFMYTEYRRKPADLDEVPATADLQADALARAYEADEATANKLYLDKVVQVSGPVAEVINQKDTLINVLIGDAASMHKVSCLLDTRHFDGVKKYRPMQHITIKGICTGFLMDVELNRAVIVEPYKP